MVFIGDQLGRQGDSRRLFIVALLAAGGDLRLFCGRCAQDANTSPRLVAPFIQGGNDDLALADRDTAFELEATIFLDLGGGAINGELNNRRAVPHPPAQLDYRALRLHLARRFDHWRHVIRRRHHFGHALFLFWRCGDFLRRCWRGRLLEGNFPVAAALRAKKLALAFAI